MAVILRAYEPADRSGCERIFRAVQGLAYPAYNQSGEGEDFDAAIAGEELWVGEIPGSNGAGMRLAGFVAIFRPERFIHHLYVDPLSHRRGIGRVLLAQALRRCGGHAELKCNEANRAAQGFYAAAGFRPAAWGWSTKGAWIRDRY